MSSLKHRLNEFADTLQEWTIRTENVEARFRERTDVAFQISNLDLQWLKAHVEGVAADVAKGRVQTVMGSPATSAQIRAVEKSVNILRASR